MIKCLWGVACLLAFAHGLTAAEEATAPQMPASAASAPVASAPEQKPVKGYVLRVAGKLVYLDLGVRDNVRVGDTFEIIRDQDIVHPVTGENLGSKAPVGVVKVTQVFEKLSVAEVVSVIPGATIMKLDRIRIGNEPMEPPPPPAPKADSIRVMPAPLPPPPPEHEMVHTPDGVVGGIGLGVGGGYETKEKANTLGAEALFPLSRRFAVGGDYSRSRASHETPPTKQTDTEEEMGGRLRVYLKRLLRGGEDINPDGETGSVVIDLGGGISRLKTTAERPVIISIDSTKTPRDTTRGTSVTTTRTTRNGMNLGVILPLAQKWTLGLNYAWEKDVSRVGSWFRYYTSAIDADWEGANPDGKIGSFVITVFGSYDSKSLAAKKWMGLDLKVPLSRMFTFGLTYDTNQKLQRISGALNVHIEKKLLR